MYARSKFIRAGASGNRTGSCPSGRSDPFSELVRQVAHDPSNPYNLDRYLWVLEEPAPRACFACGELFDPCYSYDGAVARGLPRQHCSRTCAGRLRGARHRARATQQWGSAA